MRSVVFLFCLFYTNVVGNDLKERYAVKEEYTEEDEKLVWMLMPGGKEDLQVAILRGMEPEPGSIDSVQFFLYTRENPDQPERKQWNSSCLPVFKYFKPERKTKVLVHGFGDTSQNSIMYPLLRRAYLTKGDFNILEVDWSELAAVPWYLTASRNTDRVGVRLSMLLDHLVKSTGTKPTRFHLIGFSLGSHVVGAAGRSMKTGLPSRITGLDPAQVLFTKTPPEFRLDPTDAMLVEVIHTSGGYLGFGDPIGHRDFYPNGGHWPQPGCPLDYAAICSHRRAYYYYAEGIREGKGFLSTQCDSYPYFATGQCNRNKANSIQMVNTSWNNTLVGKFFLDTNPSEPFGMMENNVDPQT